MRHGSTGSGKTFDHNNKPKDQMNITLTPQAPQVDYPTLSVLYSAPKVGKTTAAAMLPGAYTMELELNGAKHLTIAHDVYRTKEEFIAGLQALEKLSPADRPAFLVIDPIDRLEDMAALAACEAYSKKFPTQKLANAAELFALPHGLGYGFLREAFRAYLDAVVSLGFPTILLGHVRPKAFDKDVREAATDDLALTGRVRDIVCAEADLIGFLLRDKKQNLLCTTATNDKVNCGCRLARLANRDILLIENQPGKLVAHWKEIFPQLA